MKTNNSALQSVLIGLFAVLAFAVCSPSAWADCQTTHWIGGYGDWFLPENWDNCVPNSDVDASVNNGKIAVIDHQVNNDDAKALSLILGNDQEEGGYVVVDGTNGGGLAVLPRSLGNTKGNIIVGNRGSGTLSITNGGRVRSGHGIIAPAINQTGPVANGVVKMVGENSRWVLAGGESTGGTYLQVGCLSFLPGCGTGLLDLQDGATIEVSDGESATVRVGPSGTVTGNGVFIISGGIETMDMNGTLSPVGEIIIAGNLALYEPGTVQCNVTPHSADNVQVVHEIQGREVPDSGHAQLDGHLSVIMTGNFTPDTTFILLHADASLAGKFQFVSIKYSADPAHCFIPVINYDANNVYLKIKSCGY